MGTGMTDFMLPWKYWTGYDHNGPADGVLNRLGHFIAQDEAVSLSEAFQEALELLEANYTERRHDALTYAVSDDTRNFLLKHKAARGVV